MPKGSQPFNWSALAFRLLYYYYKECVYQLRIECVVAGSIKTNAIVLCSKAMQIVDLNVCQYFNLEKLTMVTSIGYTVHVVAYTVYTIQYTQF